MQEITTVESVNPSPTLKSPTMRLHLWFETEQGVLFGLGRLQLLRQVESCGSLKAAAEKPGMS